jgi:hypothetical protein
LEYINNPCSISLLAICLLDDNANKDNITAEVLFDSTDYLNACSEDVIEIWEKCKATPCKIRCVIVDDIPQEDFHDKKYSTNTQMPASEDEYEKYTYLIDHYINSGTDSTSPIHTYKLYKWTKKDPKTLKLLMRNTTS